MSLMELVIGLLISTIIILATVSYFSSLAKSVARPVIIFNGANYSLAPIITTNNDGVSKTDLFDALSLHKEFLRQVYVSDFVAVFGGSNATSSAPTPIGPLLKTFTPTTLSAISTSSPDSILTTQQLYIAAASNFSGQSELVASTDAADFTVLTMQGINAVTSIAQVRRYTKITGSSTLLTYEGKAVVLYETILSSRTLPSTTWTTYAYRFWLPADEDVWDTPTGAIHSWFRNETSWWGRSESAGATLVFPDPYALAVVSVDPVTGLAPKSKSRFAYFINTSPNF